jgi:phosphomannomutase
MFKRLRPLKIVVNSGNGAAGPTFDAIADRLASLGAPLEFIRVHHTPDATFPNGIPNPLLPENHAATANVVRAEGADFGVAFDGDFDRCFFFDEADNLCRVNMLSASWHPSSWKKRLVRKIVHDPRVIWNAQNIVAQKGGIAVQSKTGHAFVKQTMRSNEAVYGGEMSAHHYFRDFAYCDSGMIPWVLIAELLSRSERSLGDWVKDQFAAFPSSGEMNFKVADAAEAIENILSAYRAGANSIDKTDGVSLAFDDWRFNLRRSNTEPLVRLNVEGKGNVETFETHVKAISDLLGGTRA